MLLTQAQEITDEVSFFDKTFLNGKLTGRQLLIILLVAVAVALVLTFFKGIIKLLVCIVIACVALVRFGVLSPAELGDIGKQLTTEGIAKYQQFAGESENIRIVTVNEQSGEKGIEIKLMDKWVNIDEITSIVSGKKGMTVNVNGQTYTVNDTAVINMLKTFTSGNPIQSLLGVFN